MKAKSTLALDEMSTDEPTSTLTPLAVNMATAARLIGITPRWFQEIRKLPDAPPSIQLGRGARGVRYSVDSLREWLKRREVQQEGGVRE